ncbi:MAG: hypothetical protein AABN95_27325, partial [Acidobacteriota bacterium]
MSTEDIRNLGRWQLSGRAPRARAEARISMCRLIYAVSSPGRTVRVHLLSFNTTVGQRKEL